MSRPDEPGVPGGAARDDDDALERARVRPPGARSRRATTSPCSSEARPRIVSATARGCSKISLCMKCLWPSFSAATALHSIRRGARCTGSPSRPWIAIALRGEDGQLALLEEDHLARVLEDGRDVGGEEALALAVADDERRGVLRRDDLVRAASPRRPRSRRCRGTCASAARTAACRSRAPASSASAMRWAKISVSVSDANRWPRPASAALQLEVVLDDAVVDDRDAAVGVRVGVLVGRAAVRRPAGVADAGAARERRVLEQPRRGSGASPSRASPRGRTGPTTATPAES